MQVFKAAFRGYDLREVASDETLVRLAETLWRDRTVSVSLHVLRVSASSVRISVASRRLSYYAFGGAALGLLGLLGLGSLGPPLARRRGSAAPPLATISAAAAAAARRGGGFRLFRDRGDQALTSLGAVGLGTLLGLVWSRRPVLHVDLDAGTIRSGSLSLLEQDKRPAALRLSVRRPPDLNTSPDISPHHPPCLAY